MAVTTGSQAQSPRELLVLCPAAPGAAPGDGLCGEAATLLACGLLGLPCRSQPLQSRALLDRLPTLCQPGRHRKVCPLERSVYPSGQTALLQDLPRPGCRRVWVPPAEVRVSHSLCRVWSLVTASHSRL